MLQTQTSEKTKQEIEAFANFQCTHESPYHLWCKDGCWEGRGLTSRFIEAHMLNKPVRGVYCIPMLCDSTDFLGFHTITMARHPEWRERLPEMAKFGRPWQRLIRYYDELVQCFNQNQTHRINEILNGIDPNNCMLYYHKFNECETIKLKEYLVIGSLVPRMHDDEFDICPFVVHDKLPNNNNLKRFRLQTFGKDGSINGWSSCTLYHPDKNKNTTPRENVEYIAEMESKIVKSFNDSRKQYNDAMIEIWKRYKDGEVILDEEIPIQQYGEKESDEEIVQRYYDDCDNIIVKHMDKVTLFMDTDITEAKNFMEDHKLINSIIYTIESLERVKINKKSYINIEKFLPYIIKLKLIKDVLVDEYVKEYEKQFQVLEEAETYIKENCKIFKCCSYHYCPHYILYDEKHTEYNEDFNMHSAQVTTDDSYNIMTALISITKDHPLHPSHYDHEIEYNGHIYVVSDVIEKDVFYEEGLPNA
mgnify:CR=1 FL=1